MRLGSMVSACAVSALAMVFSVQQGEHGPLVVYKLQVPKATAPAAPIAPAAAPATGRLLPQSSLGNVVIPAPAPVPAPAPAHAPTHTGHAPKTPRLSPLEPTVLGTVVIPAPRRAVLQPSATAPGPLPFPLTPAEISPAPVELNPLAFGHLYRGAPVEDSDDGVLINTSTGENVTLEEVNDAVAWRRKTARKLRQLPVGPRF